MPKSRRRARSLQNGIFGGSEARPDPATGGGQGGRTAAPARAMGATGLSKRSISSILRHPDARFRIVTTPESGPGGAKCGVAPSQRWKLRWSPSRRLFAGLAGMARLVRLPVIFPKRLFFPKNV